MRTPRVIVDTIPAVGQTIRLADNEARHLAVLRRQVGDSVELLTEEGASCRARIDSLSSAKPGGRAVVEVVVRVVEVGAGVTEHGENLPLASWTLALAMVKGGAFDLALRMASELGFGRVDPVITERTIVRWRGEESKKARFERVVRESAKQCGRTPPLVVGDPQPLSDWLDEVSQRGGRRWICHVAAPVPAPRHEASDPAFPGDGPVEETVVLIGPEGGFSAAEVCLATTHGFTPYRFRTPVLKTPTAVAVVGALGLLGDQLRAES